jgi:hypothetical protein
MIKNLRKHQHVIGHWAMELFVVFAGVLIALSAQSWAEERSSRARAEAAEVRIRDELGIGIATGVERIAVRKCLKRRLAEIADGLREGRADWQSMRTTNSAAGRLAFDTVYVAPSRLWISSEYRGSVANGALDALSPERTSALASSYGLIEYLREINAEEEQLATKLAVIQFGAPLGASERTELLATLTRLDSLNGMIVLASMQNAEVYRGIYSLTSGDLAEIRKAWPAEVAALKAAYGDCVDSQAIGIFDKRLIR